MFGGPQPPFGSNNRRPQDLIQVPKLEPKDLYDRRIRRDFSRLKSYNTLLEQIYHRIYAASQLSGNTQYILYTVPPFIFGLPKLDMEDCVVYLVWQLRQNKYEVKFTYPNLLYISWKHTEGEYLAKQNPIVQAMIPEPPPPLPPFGAKAQQKSQRQPKEKKKVQIASPSDIDLVTSYNAQPGQVLSPFGGSMGTQQAFPKSAAEYKPPDSFIQNLERPGPGRDPKAAQANKDKGGNVLTDLWS